MRGLINVSPTIVCSTIEQYAGVVEEGSIVAKEIAREALKKENKDLIKLHAFQLVEITHKWECWKQAMKIATVLNKGSYTMNIDSIRNSNAIFE